MAKNMQVWWLFLIIMAFLTGCDSCYKKLKISSSKKTPENHAEFVIKKDSVNQEFNNFIYLSSFTFTLIKGEEITSNQEQVEIQAHADRMLLKKRIDDTHYFELFKDKDTFLIKNANGAWRKGDNDKMYGELIDDSLNITAWLVEQFDLKKSFSVKSYDEKNIYETSSVNLEKSSFYKDLLQKHPQFSLPVRATLHAQVATDKKTGIPTSLLFDLHMDKEQLSLDIKANMQFNHGQKQALVVPHLVGDEPDSVPVNVAPRFKDLLDERTGSQ